MDLRPRPELFDFHGVSMTRYFSENWEKIQTFKARPDDVLIVSYPKAGNTWVIYTLDELYFAQCETSVPLYARVPLLEATFPSLQTAAGRPPEIVRGTEQADNLSSSPRLIKTHLPVHLLPKSFWEQNCKIVYVARNAKDSVVSYFHFERMTMVQPEPGDWRSYIRRFMEGKMVFGSWYDHVTGWWKKKQNYSNLHYMFYEDMVEDTAQEIDKLCCFLGLSPSAEEMERILDIVQFDKMKTNNMVNHTLFRGMDFKISSFMRKGKVGDWKNHFTVTQNEEFDEDYMKKMKNSTLQFRTEI